MKDNLKRSVLAAALVAAGVLFATTSAQATIVDLIQGDSGSDVSTFFPVIGFLVAVFSTYELRRRKVKQMAREKSLPW